MLQKFDSREIIDYFLFGLTSIKPSSTVFRVGRINANLQGTEQTQT